MRKVQIKKPTRDELAARFCRAFVERFCTSGKANVIECQASLSQDCCLCTEYAAAALLVLEDYSSLQVSIIDDEYTA